MDKTSTEPKEYMLTTIDNPYDPYTQFDFWYAFDTSKRIIKEISPNNPVSTDCCAYLARIAITPDDFTEEENAQERQRAIDEIIRLDPFHIYKKAYPNEEALEKVNAMYED